MERIPTKPQMKAKLIVIPLMVLMSACGSNMLCVDIQSGRVYTKDSGSIEEVYLENKQLDLIFLTRKVGSKEVYSFSIYYPDTSVFLIQMIGGTNMNYEDFIQPFDTILIDNVSVPDVVHSEIQISFDSLGQIVNTTRQCNK